MSIDPDPTRSSAEMPSFDDLATDFDLWVNWLWRTWYVAAVNPEMGWQEIPAIVIELDVLWRSWAHAWSSSANLYDRREWLDYLPRAVDHMGRIISGWDVSAGEDPSRTAYPAATCATGSLGLPTGGHALT